MKRLLFALFSALLLVSCGKSVPEYLIEEDDLVALLADVHKSEAMMESNSGSFSSNSGKKKIREAVFLRHGVTQEQFDTTLVWYGHHIDKYMKVYDRVIERLKIENDEAKRLLAEENSQTMSQPGDSVDVWKLQRHHTFDTRLSTNLLAFDIDPDENFKQRDYFELKFKVLLLPRQSIAPYAYIAARHHNQDIVFNQTKISKEGWYSIPLQTDSAKNLRDLYGYIVLPMQAVQEKMYVDSVMLVRRHYKEGLPEAAGQKTMAAESKKESEEKELRRKEARKNMLDRTIKRANLK